MRAGLYQSHPVFGDVDLNVREALETLSSVKADLIVLPELFNTGYQFVSREETEDLAEEVPGGRTCRAMIHLAREKAMTLVFGMAEKEGANVYNSAVVAGPSGFMGRYRKTHLFAEETIHFDPGNTGFKVFDLASVRIGVMVCFDWAFPESARTLGLMGADIVCHPSNLVLPYAQGAMRTYSLVSGVFSITANRIGTEGRGGKRALTFTGRSQVVGPSGEVLAGLEESDKGLLLTDLLPEKARDKRITPQNDRLKDRRPGFYRRLAEPVSS